MLLKRRFFDYCQDWSGYHLLDLAAGTGAMGLEAYSRGAKAVIFVEKNLQIRKILQKNIEHCQLQAAKNPGNWGELHCVGQSAESYWHSWREHYQTLEIKAQGQTIIFFDPPYQQLGLYQRFFEFFLGATGPHWFCGTLWVESDEQKGFSSEKMIGPRQEICKIFRQGTRFLMGIRPRHQ